jgi:hypothetical protein
MTPSEKIDTMLADGITPLIHEVVDVHRFKYVYGSHQAIRCGDWLIQPVYGEMSDGSSCVPDRLPSAWWAHDHLYVSPFAYYGGVRKELSRRQCDMIYARLGLRYRNPLVFTEGLALACGLGRRAWKKHRSRPQAANIIAHTVPKAACWNFRTSLLADAVWVGPTTT